MKKRFYLLLPLILAACDNASVRETVGLTREAPDEFRVVSRPPLSVPPEFNLRPPAAPGEESGAAAETPAFREAQGIVLGNPPPSNVGKTNADSSFLARAGGTMADPNIRSTLSAEEAARAPEEQSVLEKLRNTTPNDPMVNAADEAARIQTNRQAGQPVNAGETPMSKPRDTGTLGRWFGY